MNAKQEFACTETQQIQPESNYLFLDAKRASAAQQVLHNGSDMQIQTNNLAKQPLAGGLEFIFWLTLIGKSRTTGWRWRNPGANGEPPRVKCFKIDNTWYISAKEIERFWARAEAGEFAGESFGVCAAEDAV